MVSQATYDEEGSVYVDGPVTSVPPAAPVAVPVHDGHGHLAILLTVLARIALREAPVEGAAATTVAPALPFTRMVRRRAG